MQIPPANPARCPRTRPIGGLRGSQDRRTGLIRLTHQTGLTVARQGVAAILLGCCLFAHAQRATPATARQMHDALVAAEHGDEAQALRLVEALLQQQPTFVPALKLQAVLLEDSGHQPEAAERFRKALEIAPDDAELQLKVGTIELVEGHTDQAITLLHKHATAQPGNSEGLFYLAQAYHRKGDNEHALDAIRRASELAPDSAPIAQKYGEFLCTSGECTEGFDVLKRAQAQDAQLPRISYDLAFASFTNQDLEQAVIYATRATEQQPADVDALALLASTRVKLAQWQEAEPVLEQVLTSRPHDSSVLLQLGHCRLELKQYPAAVESLRQSLQADPTQSLAHFFLARAYTALGDKEEARHESELHARMMQEFSFDVPKAAQQHEAELVEHARQLLASHQEAQAVALFEADSIQAHGTPATAWLAVGATYLRMNDLDQSRRALHHALELDPKVKGAYTYLGFMALEQDNLTEAEQLFQSELKLDPNHPEALAELGEIRYRQSRWEEAVQALVRSKSATPRFLFMLTDAYFHLGNIQAADLTAESLAAHAHDQPAILRSLTDLLNRNGQSELAVRLSPPHP